MGMYHHESVLVDEVCALLQAGLGKNYIDVTAGGGGHSFALLQRTGPHGKVLACDTDLAAITACRDRLKMFGERVRFAQTNFRAIDAVPEVSGWIQPIAGIIADLGMSSFHVDGARRGFSFHDTDVLDMRFNTDSGATASDVVMSATLVELIALLREYGDVEGARRIARSIIEMRDQARSAGKSVITVPMLIDAIGAAAVRTPRGIHPATKIMQALRIRVNAEYEALVAFLPKALSLLPVGGRIAVISFHSGEDRIVKRFFQRESRDCLCPPSIPKCICGHRAQLTIVTKKAVRPAAAETARNPRSRSALLRVAEKI